MKNRVMSQWMLALGMFAIVGSAFADESHVNQGKHRGEGKGIEKRLENQKRRIKRGLEKGKLTQEEAAKLEQNVDAIEAKAKSAKESGGKMTKEERQEIKKELNESSQAIQSAKQPDEKK